MKTKIVEIAIDSYKLIKFQEELRDNDFEIMSIDKLSKDINIIKIKTEEVRIKELKNLLNKLEIFFKQSN